MMKQMPQIHRQGWLTSLLFVGPALLGLVLFVAVPFILAIVLSFTNLRLGSPLATEWIGLENYRRIFADAGFLHGLANNALFAILVVPFQTVSALGLALLVERSMRAMKVFRALFFIPVIFPLSLVAVVWILIFAPGPNGMMNGLLSMLSLGEWTAKDFLHDTTWAFPAIMLTSVWQGVGFQMVILLAGLQAIPRELYESAAIDGAGSIQQLWHITLPQLRNTLIFVMLVTTILAFRLFDQVQIMTQGGPQNATTTMMYEAVQASFGRQQVARGAAMTVVLFVIVLVVTWLQRYVSREQREVQ